MNGAKLNASIVVNGAKLNASIVVNGALSARGIKCTD